MSIKWAGDLEVKHLLLVIDLKLYLYGIDQSKRYPSFVHKHEHWVLEP